MKDRKRLYKCSFDVLLEDKDEKNNVNEHWAECYTSINVVSDGDAIQAGAEAAEIALKEPRGPRRSKIKEVHLYSVVVVAHIDELPEPTERRPS